VSKAVPVAHRINGERLVLLGWTRAILLQVAHPLIAAGVHEHSGFRASPLASARRLHGTTQAMLEITFGDAERRARAIEGIRAIHDRAHGRLREPVGAYREGTPYSAHAPALHPRVHTTLIDSVLRSYAILVEPLSRSNRDAYCEASASAAEELGARAADIPRTWEDLQRFLDGHYADGTVAIGGQAREIADALLSGAFARTILPAGLLNRFMTIGLLPPPVRDAYGFPWSPAHERRFVRIARGITGVRGILPDAVACWKVARQASALDPDRSDDRPRL